MFKILKFFSEYSKKNIFLMVIFIFTSIVIAIISIISPSITGLFIDSLVEMADYTQLMNYCIIFVVLSLISIVFLYINNIMMVTIQTNISNEIIKKIVRHMRRVPLSLIETQDAAALSQKVNYDANVVTSFSLQTLKNLISHLVQFFFPIFILISINKNIGLILIGLVFIYAIVYKMFQKILYEANYKHRDIQAKYFNKIYEQLSNIKFVRSHSLGNLFNERFDIVFHQLYKNRLVSQKYNSVFTSLDYFIMLLAQVTLFLVGGSQVIIGKLSIGEFTIIMTYFNIVMQAIRYFFALGKESQDCKVSLNRIIYCLELQQEQDGMIAIDNVSSIKFCNLDFSYNEKQKLINDLNYTFSKGNIYVLKGNNGTGKTTLLSSLLGFHTGRYNGEIKINNYNINTVCTELLCSKNIGYLEQQVNLIDDTLLYNLNLNTSCDRLDNDLITQLNLNDFINRLPNDLNTFINEVGINISGGEKQKIGLYRILQKNYDVLLLDEPTAALDFESKQKLMRYLEGIKHNCIIIISSHEEIVLENADYIISLEPKNSLSI